MKKDFSALSFSEKERICESVFIANGPYWHIYTDGTRMQNIFCCEEDFATGMWALAASLHLSKKVRALTFELMSNHVHLIAVGQRENCIKAFDLFAARLRLAFPKRQRTIDWSQFKMDILPIESLQALRNEIIYANRNAFVANPSYTPDSYPWGGGCAYFSPWLKHLITSPFERLPILTQRALLHTRDISPFADLRVIGSMPFIPSFCDIKLGESMFRDARNYFNSLTRNAEAFSQIASRLKDSIFLTDDELYSVICSHINKEYSVKTPSQLSARQKIDTARHMHFGYNATNQQLRRMLRMELSILEELFP
ncbi:MAG: hypothetical protein IJ940_10255 [Bacteroidales bacterium]|nr:hypothetical protein [Bacteroidales bacterium]